ncbi:MAG: hypothetical protein ACD_3C00049G0016 [uncultured bacterium (gcode 4)]|uniref:DUF488 domain-containing protein n=1 Tax=uncultured bacterium (gcode 4) TaxID=1234023 RepID=K2GE66_9BACT|nr:MAG: hypothetical protein ACD_3C00049G0016 [uncultured bacterium (gcode 4)]
MLRSKCILSEKEESDWLRVSIMSRHTLKDWKTPDKRITPELYDSHLTEFAPLPAMVWKYYRDEIDFETYKAEYLEHLKENVKEKVIDLISLAMKIDITLLCIEESPEFCHRKILAEYAHELAQELMVGMKVEIR